MPRLRIARMDDRLRVWGGYSLEHLGSNGLTEVRDLRCFGVIPPLSHLKQRFIPIGGQDADAALLD